MSKREIPRYREKFGGTKPDYTYQRCSHGHSHVEHVQGVGCIVCDVCNTIRENLGSSPRRFEPVRQELREAA
jgi:hypothetical protein